MYRSIPGYVVFFWACTSLSAQWLHYPTAGIPRTPDGQPNLLAPAPNLADGKPDLSGIWESEQKGFSLFLNIVPTGVKDGLPYKPGMVEQARARGPQRHFSHSLPLGIVAKDTMRATVWKIVQVPGLVLQLEEWDTTYRQIFTDGRSFPTDMNPAWDGYSIGKWEGDTLVVQTTGFRDGVWLDSAGDILSDSGMVTERFHRMNFGHMEIEITVDDPKTYTKPFTFTTHERLVADSELAEYIGTDNEKDLKHISQDTPIEPKLIPQAAK